MVIILCEIMGGNHLPTKLGGHEHCVFSLSHNLARPCDARFDLIMGRRTSS